MGRPSYFAAVSREHVISALRAIGSHDPDVLDARKATLLRAMKVPKLVGISLMTLGGAVIGGLLTRTTLGALIGAPMLLVGWWLWRRGARNGAAVEAAYRDFLRLPG